MLRRVDGFKADCIEDKIIANGFDTIIREIQTRKNDKIIERKYESILHPAERLRILEQFVELFPENQIVKLSLTKEYFKYNKTTVLGISLLRTIEEQIEYNYQILISEKNFEQIITEREMKNEKRNEKKEIITSIYHSFQSKIFLSLYANNQKLENILLCVYLYAILQNKQESIKYFRKIEELYPGAVYLNTLYAKRLDAIGKYDEASNKREIFAAWLMNEEISTKRKENAIRSVLEINHNYTFINKTVIAIRTGTEKEAIFEKELLERARKILKNSNEFNYGEFDIISSNGIFEKGGLFYHILKRNNGVSLLSKLEDKLDSLESYQLLGKTIKFLSFLHAEMEKPIIFSNEKARQLGNKLYLRLLSTGLVAEDTAFLKSLQELSSFFQYCFVTYNKDSHPDNWNVEMIYDKGKRIEKIIALDFQKKEAMPQVFDIVNLLNYGNYTTIEEKKQLIGIYYDCFNTKHKLESKVSNDEFFFLYLQATVYRAMNIFCAWQNPRKIGMLTRLPIILQNGLDSIKDAQKDYVITGISKETYPIIENKLEQLLEIANNKIPYQ